MADPECARGRGVSHILVEKRCVSFTLFKNMHENSIFSPITGGVRRVRPMLDPPLKKREKLFRQHFEKKLQVIFHIKQFGQITIKNR